VGNKIRHRRRKRQRENSIRKGECREEGISWREREIGLAGERERERASVKRERERERERDTKEWSAFVDLCFVPSHLFFRVECVYVTFLRLYAFSSAAEL
jgi:hypothetical protein